MVTPQIDGPAARGCRNETRQAQRVTVAEAERSDGRPNTLRQPSLRLARCFIMQAMMRSRSGISDEHSRNTSPVHSRRWSSSVKAWPARGLATIASASPAIATFQFRILNR